MAVSDYIYKSEGADEDGEEAEGPLSVEEILAFDGNIAELLNKHELTEIGAKVVREFELDKAARKDWEATARKALDVAAQKKGEAKTYPFLNAANIKYPLLTTAAMQFAARAYPAIVRGDEVVDVKVSGRDDDGMKSARAERVGAWINDQLIYECPEWERGTDQMLHALPTIGSAFRKVYWAGDRPRIEYANAMDVYVPMDAPSLELTPRITYLVKKYPYEVQRLTRGENSTWLKHDYEQSEDDAQKRIEYLEQCRYCDLDEDGLDEPYVVTVHKDTQTVVRIDPIYDIEDVDVEPGEMDPQTGQPGAPRIVAIRRMLPWVDYGFIPDPEGGIYSIGYGKLLEAISETIDATLNQLIDAGHWANTLTGFVGAGVHVRGGTLSLRPNEFQQMAGVSDVRNAIMPIQFPGPSQVLYSLLEYLIDAAKDITAVKDVLTGDAPGQQPATSTVALIEQGLTVFSSIYKRIYRSMTREMELLCKLYARYLPAEQYQKFLDERPPAPQQPTQAPPQGAMPPQMPPQPGQPEAQPMPPMQGAPQEPAFEPPDPKKDFDLRDLDIRPVADPTAITEMQRMAKANFLKETFRGDPTINQAELNKRIMQAARLPKIEDLMAPENPLIKQQAEMQQAGMQADLAVKQADAAQRQAIAQKTSSEPGQRERELAIREREVAIKERELDLKEQELAMRIVDAEIAREVEADRTQIEGYKTSTQDHLKTREARPGGGNGVA